MGLTKKITAQKGHPCPPCPSIGQGAIYRVRFPERLENPTVEESEIWRSLFIIKKNPTAYFCIQNDTNECGHYLGRQGLWRRWIIQSPLFASILIIVIWVLAVVIFAVSCNYASWLLFSKPSHGGCQVLVFMASYSSFLTGNIPENIYYKLEIHIFLANLFFLLLNSLMHRPLHEQKSCAKWYVKMS